MTKLILSGRQGAEILQLHPQLQKVLIDILFIWPVEDCFITSIWRSSQENLDAKAKTKIHVVGPPYRAIDLRVSNLGNSIPYFLIISSDTNCIKKIEWNCYIV